MIQAEDRCHRIGQQARVRCLYFIARGTLDEILWKLIEKKFRDLGEFVEGRENMDIALERELEEDEESEILKVEAIEESKKRKSQEDFSTLFDDLEDVGGSIKEEINDLVHEEEDMLKLKNEDEVEDEPDEEETGMKPPSIEVKTSTAAQASTASSETPVISLLDEEEKEEEPVKTVQEMRDSYVKNGVLAGIKLDHTVRFKNISLYTMRFHGQRYGFNMLFLQGRAVVKEPLDSGTKLGSIIVAVGSHVLVREPFEKIRARMRNGILTNAYVSLTFALDEEFTALLKEEVLPRFARAQKRKTVQAARQVVVAAQQARPKPTETVNLLDDDE